MVMLIISTTWFFSFGTLLGLLSSPYSQVRRTVDPISGVSSVTWVIVRNGALGGDGGGPDGPQPNVAKRHKTTKTTDPKSDFVIPSPNAGIGSRHLQKLTKRCCPI